MSKQQNKRIWDWNPKPRSVIIVGILLFLLVVLVHGHAEYQITASLAPTPCGSSASAFIS